MWCEIPELGNFSAGRKGTIIPKPKPERRFIVERCATSDHLKHIAEITETFKHDNHGIHDIDVISVKIRVVKICLNDLSKRMRHRGVITLIIGVGCFINQSGCANSLAKRGNNDDKT